MGSLYLYLSNDVRFSVKLYKLLLPAKRPNSIWLVARTNLPAKVTTRFLDTTTGANVDEMQIMTYFDISGEIVPFTKSDIYELTHKNEICSHGYLKILYFTSKSNLTNDLNFTSPSFLYPDEKRIKGSTTICLSMITCMVQKELIAIAVFLRNKSSTSRLVALIPSLNSKNNEPDGLLLVPLPYDGEVRSSYVDEGSGMPPSTEAVSAAEDIVKALQLEDDFDYRTLESPAMQKYYSGLQVRNGEQLHKPFLDQLLNYFDAYPPGSCTF